MEAQPVAPGAPAGPGQAADGPAVLLIDDEDQVRLVVQRQLERLGYRVLAAADGREGFAAVGAAAAPPRAALIDMTLPELDGAAVARALLAEHPGLAVILMSGYRPEELAPRLSGLAIAGFLQKPFSLAELRAALAAALGE